MKADKKARIERKGSENSKGVDRTPKEKIQGGEEEKGRWKTHKKR